MSVSLLRSDQNPIYQVIAAEGEQKASRALREAAEVISESPSALQVRMTDVFWSLINKHLAAEISTNPEYNICRAQLHHHLPDASQYHGSVRRKNQTELRWRSRTKYLSSV